MTIQRPTRPARAAGLVLAGVLALTLAVAAYAKPRWQLGKAEGSTVQACSSVGLEPLYYTGVYVQTWFHADPKALPKTGQTFYARVAAGAPGAPCVVQAASIEVVPPRGVQLAITAKTPVRCYAYTAKSTTRLPSAQGCPQRVSRGPNGFLLARTTRRDGLWELPTGNGIQIDVPLRSTRRLKGILSPTCARLAEQPPCPAARAGDSLQFAVRVADGNRNPWLVPHVGLFVR